MGVKERKINSRRRCCTSFFADVVTRYVQIFLLVSQDFSPPANERKKGATQAIEDGAVYACCVAKMPDNLPLALRVAEQLRMPRVTAAQEMGEQQRKDWHQKGGEEKYVKDKMAMKSSAYFNYDAEQDVDDRFDAMVQELKKKGITGKTL